MCFGDVSTLIVDVDVDVDALVQIPKTNPVAEGQGQEVPTSGAFEYVCCSFSFSCFRPPTGHCIQYCTTVWVFSSVQFTAAPFRTLLHALSVSLIHYGHGYMDACCCGAEYLTYAAVVAVAVWYFLFRRLRYRLVCPTRSKMRKTISSRQKS